MVEGRVAAIQSRGRTELYFRRPPSSEWAGDPTAPTARDRSPPRQLRSVRHHVEVRMRARAARATCDARGIRRMGGAPGRCGKAHALFEVRREAMLGVGEVSAQARRVTGVPAAGPFFSQLHAIDPERRGNPRCRACCLTTPAPKAFVPCVQLSLSATIA
jgi:hypothetical protein